MSFPGNSCQVCVGLGLAVGVVIQPACLMAHATHYTQHAAQTVHITLHGWSQISGRAAAAELMCSVAIGSGWSSSAEGNRSMTAAYISFACEGQAAALPSLLGSTQSCWV